MSATESPVQAAAGQGFPDSPPPATASPGSARVQPDAVAFLVLRQPHQRRPVRRSLGPELDAAAAAPPVPEPEVAATGRGGPAHRPRSSSQRRKGTPYRRIPRENRRYRQALVAAKKLVAASQGHPRAQLPAYHSFLSTTFALALDKSEEEMSQKVETQLQHILWSHLSLSAATADGSALPDDLVLEPDELKSHPNLARLLIVRRLLATPPNRIFYIPVRVRHLLRLIFGEGSHRIEAYEEYFTMLMNHVVRVFRFQVGIVDVGWDPIHGTQYMRLTRGEHCVVCFTHFRHVGPETLDELPAPLMHWIRGKDTKITSVEKLRVRVKLTPCGHDTFCDQCVQTLAKRAHGEAFPCPLCRCEVVCIEKSSDPLLQQMERLHEEDAVSKPVHPRGVPNDACDPMEWMDMADMHDEATGPVGVDEPTAVEEV